MKWVGRIVYALCILLLWIAALAIALEGWTRWQWQRIEKYNPFLLSLYAGELWPIDRDESDLFSEYLHDEALRQRFLGPGKSSGTLPEASYEEEMRKRYSFFLQLSFSERQMFSNTHLLHFYALKRNGRAVEYLYNPDMNKELSLQEVIPEEDLQHCLAAFDEILHSDGIQFITPVSQADAPDFQYALFSERSIIEESGEEFIWLSFPGNRDNLDIPGDSLWDVPFFIAKKHVERQNIINVLELTEHFYMNNCGFRDADIIVPKPEDCYRILCIGASTTEEGPANEFTYPAILETLLNRHFGKAKVDVINCGLSGMNSNKHKMRLADYLAMEPDMILVYNAVNDICHELIPEWMDQATPFQQFLRHSQVVIRYLGSLLLPSREKMVEDIDQFKIANLRFIQRNAAKRKVSMAICSFAAPERTRLVSKERDYYEYTTRMKWGGRYISFDSYLLVLNLYNQALKQFCEDEGLLYIPVAENLIGTANFFGDICHQRNPGIERKASIICESLMPFLEKELAARD